MYIFYNPAATTILKFFLLQMGVINTLCFRVKSVKRLLSVACIGCFQNCITFIVGYSPLLLHSMIYSCLVCYYSVCVSVCVQVCGMRQEDLGTESAMTVIRQEARTSVWHTGSYLCVNDKLFINKFAKARIIQQ